MVGIIINFLKFLFKSTNNHGVHSPFVFKLVSNGLYKKIDTEKWKKFLKFKKEYLRDTREINVTDFGAGSKVFKTNSRKISKITSVAGISNKKAKIIFSLIGYFKPKNILEIGTSIGLGTSSFSLASPTSKIKTLEGCANTAKIAKEYFIKNNLKNIEITVGNFTNTLPVLKNNSFDCVYFDGNHTKKATLNYFETCISTKNNNSFWIFDDIYLDSEMKETWETIKKRPEVTVTVDVFYFGIVFFRKEQAKEHFKIRI